LLLDGSEKTDKIIKSALSWDVMGGIARRSWARNKNAVETALAWNEKHDGQGHITLPFQAEEGAVEKLVGEMFG